MNTKSISIAVRFAAALGLLACFTTLGVASETEAEAERSYSQWTWNEAALRSVFDQLSKVGGTDIVVDPGVQGKVTLAVTNKSWRDVFDIVCRMNALEAIKEPNYVYVMTSADYQSQLAKKESSKQGLSELSELEREVIKLSNTAATEMSRPIQDLLSRRGKLTVVEHNNSIIVYDTRENIRQIRALVTTLDIEVEQISISAKIIEVASGHKNDMGVRWQQFNNSFDVGNGGSVGSYGISHLPAAKAGDAVVSGALERMTFGIISKNSLSMTFDYLMANSKSEVVAQPQITTLDNKEARIFMGSQIPVTSLDIAQNTIVTMVNAGTELIVLPHVTSEGRIMLDLKPSKKSYTLTASGQPIINEQSAKTNVVVNDGETVVIAGLTSNEDQKTEGGIPLLKDIPILGNLFKKSSKVNDKKDLIIFVTPHIIKKSYTAPVAAAADSSAGAAVIPAAAPATVIGQ